MRTSRLFAMALLIAAPTLGRAPDALAADTSAGAPPAWRIAKLSKPPVVDGVIHDKEYAECPAITGMITQGPLSIVTRQQDVTWYIGYDDTNIYIAMRSPHPKGTWPIANVKENELSAILWDDHVEIQLATKGRQNACMQGMGFYKIMANARGFHRDEWLYNGTVGSETLWSFGGEMKCSTNDEHWDLEVAAPIKAFGEKKLDGRDWVVQLVRADSCAGNYFAGWVGAPSWLDWHLFGDVVFDPAAPVFRFLQTGEIRKGDMNLEFEVVGKSAEPQQVLILASVTDPKGVELYNKSQSVTVKPGEKQTVSFKQALTLPDGGSSLRILASYDKADGEKVKLYDVKIPVAKLTDEVFKAQVQPWQERRPKAGDFRWSFAYWASYGVAESSIDVDFFGMDKNILNASAFEVAIYPKGADKALTAKRSELKNHQSAMILEPGKLPEGEYVARLKLFGADGTSLVGEREEPFTRKVYPWEGNTLGTQEMVFPPFTAIQVDKEKNIRKPCLREYRLAPDGRPAGIKAEGGEGLEDILTAPIHWEAEAGGQVVAQSEAQSKIVEATDTKVRVESGFKLGPATVTLSSTMDMTGWYDVKMSVKGAPGGKLDRLTLVIPLWAQADTMYIQRFIDGPDNGKGGLPVGQGVVWHSGLLLKTGFMDDVWRSFVPIAYLGNGDKGVWWLGDDNRDWVMSDALPAAQYVRTGKGVELRINVFAGAASLDRERTLRFALLVDPVKKTPNERKIGWGREGYDFGDYLIFGWRRWGRSDDGYWVENEDLDALDKLLRGIDRRPQNPRGGFNDSYMENLFKRCRQDYQKGRKLVLYGSHSNMMYDLPEWESFGGEWAGRKVKLDDKPLAESQQGYNIQGSYKITRTREKEEVFCNWTDSQVQCFIWYHQKLLAKTPASGTWWDNGSTFLIKDYDPIRKEFYHHWNVLMRHDLCKRLNTIGWQLGREPWWLNNMGADWAFNQVAWHVENGFDQHSSNQDDFDVLSLDEFRALFRTRRGIVHLLASWCTAEKVSTAEEIRRRNRLKAGLCLLHDIGITAEVYRRGLSEDNKVMSDLMDKYVGFFSEEQECRFTGYWRAGKYVKIKSSRVHASVYKGKNRAVLVVVNENREPVSAEFSFTRELLGRDPAKVFDAETGREFHNGYYYDTQGKAHQAWGQYKPGFFPIEGHGVRLIVLE